LVEKALEQGHSREQIERAMYEWQGSNFDVNEAFNSVI